MRVDEDLMVVLRAAAAVAVVLRTAAASAAPGLSLRFLFGLFDFLVRILFDNRLRRGNLFAAASRRFRRRLRGRADRSARGRRRWRLIAAPEAAAAGAFHPADPRPAVSTVIRAEET